MLRLVELALFLAPFVAFIAWRFMALESGPPLSIVVAAACAMIVLAASLVWLNREEALAPGTVYEPPHMQDGQVISGRGVPR
ncbi:MAG TPA: DUF6111 family protein [Acetobacteraceae bacterium]|jgi:hypothetical protein|nr:DUF6111 family protein [Acetobacteraceae bacterium]